LITYDNHFNENEWSIILALGAGAVILYFLPRRFSNQTAGVFLLCGVFFGFLFDHTLSVLPVSFYDLNDTSSFEWFDFLSQCMYGPYGYLYFYLYDRFRVKLRYAPVYILVCALISVGLEKILNLLGVYHYQKGYYLYFSFVIYLAVLSSWVGIYYTVKKYGEKLF
jgi:hypothetical protein